MDDAFAQMVQAQYPPLNGRVIFYDEETPGISADNPIIAITRAVSQERGYDLSTGPTGRAVVSWEITVQGLRQNVQAAMDNLPGALTAHYRYEPPAESITHPMTVLGSYVTEFTNPERADRPTGIAEGKITLTSEVILG